MCVCGTLEEASRSGVRVGGTANEVGKVRSKDIGWLLFHRDTRAPGFAQRHRGAADGRIGASKHRG